MYSNSSEEVPAVSVRIFIRNLCQTQILALSAKYFQDPRAVRDDLNVILVVSSEPSEADHRSALPLFELDYCSPIVLSIALIVKAITIIKLRVELVSANVSEGTLATKPG
jgi:hypothetical protein